LAPVTKAIFLLGVNLFFSIIVNYMVLVNIEVLLKDIFTYNYSCVYLNNLVLSVICVEINCPVQTNDESFELPFLSVLDNL
jgi:hypothetical protein